MFISKIRSWLRQIKSSTDISMWKTFYIKPNEIGILYHRSDFKKILTAGTHTYFGRYWRVEKFDLNYPEAKIENLELLLRDNTAELQEYLLILRTNFNETALVRMGQKWINILPNQLRAFWRGFIEVESHIFNLEENLELPTQLVQQLRGFDFSGLTKIFVNEYQIGLLYVQNDFVRPLEPGEYAFWSINKGVTHHVMNRLDYNPNFFLEEVFINNHPEFVATYCAMVETTAQQVANIRYQGKVISILPPTSRKLFWQGVDIEIIDIQSF